MQLREVLHLLAQAHRLCMLCMCGSVQKDKWSENYLHRGWKENWWFTARGWIAVCHITYWRKKFVSCIQLLLLTSCTLLTNLPVYKHMHTTKLTNALTTQLLKRVVYQLAVDTRTRQTNIQLFDQWLACKVICWKSARFVQSLLCFST